MSDLSLVASIDRLVDAVDRLTKTLKAMQGSTSLPGGVTVTLDGRRLAQEVVHYTVSRATRGSSNFGGRSVAPPEKKD